MMRSMLIAAALAALAIPAAAPADARHGDRWEHRDNGRHWRSDRWDRRHWRGHSNRRWRGHSAWRWRSPPPRRWRQACRGVWWNGWEWRCRR